MPILKATINVSQNKNKKVRLLIDSGAAINLISGEIAAELEKGGAQFSREGDMRIKVANGRKCWSTKFFISPYK